MSFTNLTVGSIASYTCDLGFELIGDPITTCTQVDMDNAAFEPAPPSCRREFTDYNPLGITTCNFQLNVSVTVACSLYGRATSAFHGQDGSLRSTSNKLIASQTNQLLDTNIDKSHLILQHFVIIQLTSTMAQ